MMALALNGSQNVVEAWLSSGKPVICPPIDYERKEDKILQM